MLRILIAIFAALLLAACSSIPDVEYSYYPPKSNTTISITQTLSCNEKQTAFLVMTTPSITSTYAADYNRGPYKIRVRDVEGNFGAFADSEATFQFYDDGRLKSINQSTTGQGETVIKSAVTLATTLGSLGWLTAKFNLDKGGPPNLKDECDAIAKSAADGKATSATLTYNLSGDLLTMVGSSPQAPITVGSQKLFDAINLHGKVPRPTVVIGGLSDTATRAGVPCGSSSGDTVELKLQKVGNVRIDVKVDSNSVWTGTVAVPGADVYCLPIPRAALFGKQTFALSLSDAGIITSVNYAKVSGAAGALNAANAALVPETPAGKVADVKAQADLIAQHQRLMKCQANPSACN